MAPLAPAAAAPAILLAAFAAHQADGNPVAATAKPAKKSKKKRAAEEPAALDRPARAPVGSPLGLARSALTGAPIPGGVAALGAVGVAGAFAGMGLGNGAAALCVLVTWAAVAFAGWRTGGAGESAPKWAAIAAIALAPIAALALGPWAVPATESREVRIGLAVVGFAIIAAVAMRARRLDARPPAEPISGAGPSRLAPIGRLIDRVLAAPLDLLALPFSRTEPQSGEREGSS